MGRTMRSRGVSSYRAKKRTKRRGNKLSRRISKRRVKRSNKRSNRRLNKRSNKRLNRRVSKRMRNNPKSFRRRGGAPPPPSSLPDTAAPATTPDGTADTGDPEYPPGYPKVRLRCLGFQELGTDPRTNTALTSWGTGAYKKFFYLIMIAVEMDKTSEKEVYFIRRRWSQILNFIKQLLPRLQKILRSEISLYRDIFSGSKEFLSITGVNESRKQGLFDSYLIKLSNCNIGDPNKMIGILAARRDGFFGEDIVEFPGKLPAREITELNLSKNVLLGSISSFHPKNRASELLDVASGGPRYSISCIDVDKRQVDGGRVGKYFYCIVVKIKGQKDITIWRRWSQCIKFEYNVYNIGAKVVPPYRLKLTRKVVEANDTTANSRRAELDDCFNDFATWVNTVYRESEIDLMKKPTGPGDSNKVDPKNVVHNFFFKERDQDRLATEELIREGGIELTSIGK